MLNKEKQLMLDLLIEKYETDNHKIEVTSAIGHRTMDLKDYVKSMQQQRPRKKKRAYLGGRQWTVAELVLLNELCAEPRTSTVSMARQIQRTVSSINSMINVVNRGKISTPTMKEYLQTGNFDNLRARSDYWRHVKNIKHF